MITYEHKVRIGYKDTDQMGYVHHSNYIVFYEQARTEMLRSMNLTYSELEKTGVMSPILEIECKYIKPVHYDELITVKVILEKMPVVKFDIRYEVYNQAGELCNTGRSILAFVSSDTRRPCRIPEYYRVAFEKAFVEDK